MIEIKPYTKDKIITAIKIWNEIVREGVAFPQEEELTEDSGDKFFSSQSFTGLAIEADEIFGLYILHPNNVGRCGHIANASYAVRADVRGKHIGEIIVTHSINKARELGFRILQFNAVVADNIRARKLYRKLGFTELGIIPGGFRMNENNFADIIPHFIELV